MQRSRFAVYLALAIVFGLSSVPIEATEDSVPATAEQLFLRSARAYGELPAVEIVFESEVRIPNSETGSRDVRYVLGKGGEAVIEIGSVMRVVANNDSIFVERGERKDRYLEVPSGGDLAAAMASIRGRSSLAGLREPPQAALKAGRQIAGILDAFRYSSMLGELTVAGIQRLPGPTFEVRLEAENGFCLANFDGTTFLLRDVEYRIEPPQAPRGYAMQILGRYSTRPIEYDASLFKYNPGQRSAVDTLRALSPGPPGISAPAVEIVSPSEISGRLLQLKGLATALEGKRVLLVGEDHLYEEPPQYLTALLEEHGSQPVSLLLELPYDVQDMIEKYLEDGDEATLDEIFTGRPVLQLQHLLRWAHKNRELVPTVKAIDEPLYEIRLKRAFLEDTRNPTMAAAIHREWVAHPDRRIVAYAGQLHLMKSGRYKVDRPSRDTAGSRLPQLGIPRDQIAVIAMNGGENYHLHSAWQTPGVLPLDGDPVRIPISYFIDYPIFGIEFADEGFDYFVNLGPLTRIEVR